jgi:hypothetical protein
LSWEGFHTEQIFTGRRGRWERPLFYPELGATELRFIPLELPLPQCVSFRSVRKTRSRPRFIARSMLTRAWQVTALDGRLR